MKPSPGSLVRATVAFLCLSCFAGACASTRVASGGAKSGTRGGGSTAPHRGLYQLDLPARGLPANPFFDAEVKVRFTRPDGTSAVVDAFFDGGTTFRARAYCDTVGAWTWQAEPRGVTLDTMSGRFDVTPSKLPGKLRVHAKDPRQFAYDDGRYFLHLGDTAYRFVADMEPNWQAYLDQAAAVGFTKIRVWFARSRHHVEALYTPDRAGMNLPYWQEIERRMLHALDRYPHMIFQLIPYAEDAPELRRYGAGDRASRFVGRYAQARFSALPNVMWVVSNDQTITLPGKPPAGEWRDVDFAAIDQAGRDFKAREPWGTLISNHQARETGFAFVDAPWTDLITIQGLDQVAGARVAEYRAKREQPVVYDEDRYEQHRNPGAPRYFFRRLFWATLLSGGHPTYGGNRMFEVSDGTPLRGIHGYDDLVRAGVLQHGAKDFVQIRRFFDETGVTPVGLVPDDAFVGGDPTRWKGLRGPDVAVVYLANPSGTDARTAVGGWDAPSVQVTLPAGRWTARWFDPRSGKWHDAPAVDAGAAATKLTAPSLNKYLAAEDWVLLLRRLPGG